MAQVTVTWLQNLQFVGTDSTKHSVVLSGAGPEDGVGMKPSELLLISLGACTAYDVVNILRKKREKIQDVRVSVDGEQNTEAPWAFRKIHLHYEISGRGLAPEVVEQAIKLSEEKYCSVAATLRAGVEISYDYEIIDTAD